MNLSEHGVVGDGGVDGPGDERACELIDGSPAMTSSQLFGLLDGEGIEYDVQHHAALRTVDDAKAIRYAPGGGHTKNLFVRNKKGRMWLLTLHEERRVDLKATAALLNAGNFSFASEDRLMKYLGVIPGAVSAFSILNDVTEKVGFVIDEALLSYDRWHLHPLDNTMTVTIDREALLSFLVKRGRHYKPLP